MNDFQWKEVNLHQLVTQFVIWVTECKINKGNEVYERGYEQMNGSAGGKRRTLRM